MTAPAPVAGLEQAVEILSRLIAFDTESSKSNLELVAGWKAISKRSA